MTFYKIRHKASGLFYKPAQDTKDFNLSKQGKVYQRKPTVKHMGDRVRLGFGEIGVSWMKAYYRRPNSQRIQEVTAPFRPGEWEIVKYETVESVEAW